MLRLADGSEIQNEYYPGHLKGDRVQLLATPRQLDAFPADRLARRRIRLPVQLQRIVDMADAIRLEFQGGLRLKFRAAHVDRNNGDWLIEFPRRGLRVI